MAGFQFYARGGIIEIDILEDISFDNFSAKELSERLREAGTSEIQINMSSLGGDLGIAMAMHDLIRAYPGRTVGNVMGLTASSGTVIISACDHIRMSEDALFLIHPAWSSVKGNADDMRKAAESLDMVSGKMAKLYARRTGNAEDEIISLMRENRWMDAQEALSLGFIDELYTPAKAAASAVRAKIEELKGDERLPALPDVILNKKNEMADEKNWLENLRTDILNVIRGVKAETEEPPVKEEEVAEPETETPETEEEVPEIDKEKEIEVATAEAVAEKELELEAAQARIAEINAKLEENEGKLAKIQAMVDRLQAKDIAPAGETEMNPNGEFSGQKSPFDDSAAALRKEFGNY